MASFSEGVLSAARFARRIPGSWRLWVIALPLFAATSLSGLAPSLLAGVLTYLLWSSLHPIASTYLDPSVTGMLGPQSSRRQRLVGFVASLVVISALGIQAIASLGGWIGDTSYRIPEVILIGSLTGILFVYGMFSMWWKFGYAVLTSAVLLAAGFLGVWIGLDHILPPESMAESWGRNAIRIAVVFLAAEWLNWLQLGGYRRPLFGWGERVDNEFGLLTPAFTVAFAILAQQPDAIHHKTPTEFLVWITVAIATGGAILFILSRSRVLASRDVRWIQSRWKKNGNSAMPSSIGLFTAIALTPALALTPIVTWPAWILVLAIGLFAAMLRSWSGRLRGRGAIAKTTSRGPSKVSRAT